MNIIQKYRAYFNDNPQGYWFERKVWGWGWTPVRWQGWLTLLIFISLIVWTAVSLARSAQGGVLPSGEPGIFIGKIAILILALTWVCYLKGEKPAWTWGFPPKQK